MKRWFLFLIMLVSVALLPACKAQKSSIDEDGQMTAAAVEKSKPQKYEYKVVIANCSIDRDTQKVACQFPGQVDTTYLEKLINSEAEKGWELDEILRDEGHYSLIMRRDK